MISLGQRKPIGTYNKSIAYHLDRCDANSTEGHLRQAKGLNLCIAKKNSSIGVKGTTQGDWLPVPARFEVSYTLFACIENKRIGTATYTM